SPAGGPTPARPCSPTPVSCPPPERGTGNCPGEARGVPAGGPSAQVDADGPPAVPGVGRRTAAPRVRPASAAHPAQQPLLDGGGDVPAVAGDHAAGGQPSGAGGRRAPAVVQEP